MIGHTHTPIHIPLQVGESTIPSPFRIIQLTMIGAVAAFPSPLQSLLVNGPARPLSIYVYIVLHTFLPLGYLGLYFVLCMVVITYDSTRVLFLAWLLEFFATVYERYMQARRVTL